MSTGFILQSTKPNGPKFDIISYDPATKLGELKGSLGKVFPHNLDKEYLKNLGYKIVPKQES